MAIDPLAFQRAYQLLNPHPFDPMENAARIEQVKQLRQSSMERAIQLRNLQRAQAQQDAVDKAATGAFQPAQQAEVRSASLNFGPAVGPYGQSPALAAPGETSQVLTPGGVDHAAFLQSLNQQGQGALAMDYQQKFATQDMEQQKSLLDLQGKLADVVAKGDAHSKAALENIKERLDLTGRAADAALSDLTEAPPEMRESVYQYHRQQALNSGLMQPGELPDHYVPGIESHLQTLVRDAVSVKDAINQAQRDNEAKSKTVQTAQGVMGFNPKTGAYDVKIGNLPKTVPSATVVVRNGQGQGQGGDIPLIDSKTAPNKFKIAQDVAYGRLTFSQLRSMYAYSRDTQGKLSLYATAKELNPNFDPAQFEAGFTLAKNPRVQQQLASLDNVLVAVPDLIRISDQASRTGVKALNSIILKGGAQIGNKKYSNFHTAQVAFADELSGALGFGSATDMSREMGFNMTDPSLSPEQFASAIHDVVVPFIERKRDTLLKQMGPYGEQGRNPANPATSPTQGGGFFDQFPEHR